MTHHAQFKKNMVRVKDRSGRTFYAEWDMGYLPTYRVYEDDGETEVKGVTEVTLYFNVGEPPTIEYTVIA